MDIRQLTSVDTNQFCELIIDMYSHLENLEWFTPMPYDSENVQKMIENPRFYIIGFFDDNNNLLAVSSLDYKCGKLLDKIAFPPNFDLESIVEIGFNIVHSSFRGHKAMQILVGFLLEKLKIDGFKHVFAKVHQDNIASEKSLTNTGFEIFETYQKPVSKTDFENLANADFFSASAKPKAMETLAKYVCEEHIVVSYNILIKNI